MMRASEPSSSSDVISPVNPITVLVTSTWEADGKVRIKGAKTASYLLPEIADRLNRGLLAVSSMQPFKKEAPCQGPVSTQCGPGHSTAIPTRDKWSWSHDLCYSARPSPRSLGPRCKGWESGSPPCQALMIGSKLQD